MSDGKPHQFRPPLYHSEPGADNGRRDASVQRDRPAQQLREQKGWDAYRKWLSSVSGNKPQSERAPVDASIYSWKGYHNWADRVRQSWKAEEKES